ncbi:MAG: pilus assembly protein [Anaerolineaceae bacterium]|nr:pilus assembly protein [Anaerolineaceae bacterium]
MGRRFLMRYRRRFQGNERSSQGQSLVEFALVLPILILLMIGILEFGYFFFIYSTVNNAAREAVRYGAAIGESDNADAPYYRDCVGIREVARRLGRYAGVQDSATEHSTHIGIDIGYDDGPDPGVDWSSYTACPSDPALGDRIVVRVRVFYHPIVIQLNIQDILIEAQSARTLIRNVDVSK